MITEFSSSVPLLPRPRNLQEFVEGETIVPESTESAFTLDDISDSEDIWIMNIPRTINPQDLNGQTLILGDKSKIKVREERYCAVNHSVKGNVTCVFNTEKLKSKYKTVNIKPAGAIMVRRKLSGITKIKPIDIEQSGVPFPKNLKPRHPLFDVHPSRARISTREPILRGISLPISSGNIAVILDTIVGGYCRIGRSREHGLLRHWRTLVTLLF
ncbi:hypothetical protein KM043_006208 [Ampulex compressa]|nr:hypothetical protein KM043_006208 [Ampulex compressa]